MVVCSPGASVVSHMGPQGNLRGTFVLCRMFCSIWENRGSNYRTRECVKSVLILCLVCVNMHDGVVDYLPVCVKCALSRVPVCLDPNSS